VEGPLDKSVPVVIIDDSVSSGNSIAEAIRAIEAEGAEVEGAIALVQFPHRGGLDWANRPVTELRRSSTSGPILACPGRSRSPRRV
jgi:orotate phosphoribosyltransferase